VTRPAAGWKICSVVDAAEPERENPTAPEQAGGSGWRHASYCDDDFMTRQRAVLDQTARRLHHFHDREAEERRTRTLLRAQRALTASRALLQRLHAADVVSEQEQIDQEIRLTQQAYLREQQQALVDAATSPQHTGFRSLSQGLGRPKPADPSLAHPPAGTSATVEGSLPPAAEPRPRTPQTGLGLPQVDDHLVSAGRAPSGL